MALSQIPNPYAVSYRDFVDTLIGWNAVQAAISPDDPWQVTADRLTETEQNAPRAAAFKDWREWAAALKQAYPG